MFPEEMDSDLQGTDAGTHGGILLPCFRDPSSPIPAGKWLIPSALAAVKTSRPSSPAGDTDPGQSPELKKMVGLGTWAAPTSTPESPL